MPHQAGHLLKGVVIRADEVTGVWQFWVVAVINVDYSGNTMGFYAGRFGLSVLTVPSRNRKAIRTALIPSGIELLPNWVSEALGSESVWRRENHLMTAYSRDGHAEMKSDHLTGNRARFRGPRSA